MTGQFEGVGLVGTVQSSMGPRDAPSLWSTAGKFWSCPASRGGLRDGASPDFLRGVLQSSSPHDSDNNRLSGIGESPPLTKMVTGGDSHTNQAQNWKGACIGPKHAKNYQDNWLGGKKRKKKYPPYSIAIRTWGLSKKRRWSSNWSPQSPRFGNLQKPLSFCTSTWLTSLALLVVGKRTCISVTVI